MPGWRLARAHCSPRRGGDLMTYGASVASGHPAPIAAKFARARRDPVGVLIAGCCGAGLRFRWSGATLEVDGLERLSDRDQALFQAHEQAILERLAEPGGDGAALLDELEVWHEMVRTRERAAEVVGELPASCGLDCETASQAERPWIAITRKGERASNQPKPTDRGGLDPHKARVRLVQVYSPEHEAVFLFDTEHVSIELLVELGLFKDRKFVAHNAAFEAMMLRAHERGIELVDSMQLAGLVLDCQRGVRKIENVAREILGITLLKEQQVSDWGARLLSHAQVNYAAADAVVCHRAARGMYRLLGPDERRCFEVQNAAIPVIARMRLVGCPFVPEIHRETIRKWEVEHAENRAEFVAITGEDPPVQGKVGRWIEAHLPAEEIAWMPRTKTGQLSAKSEDLEHLAHRTEIRPLLRVLWSDKRLRSFGYGLLDSVSPVTGRVHPDFMLGAKSGRLACSDPNFQQLPPDVRLAIVAPAGRVLVVADSAPIELRVLAELSGDDALREEFYQGGDVHRAAAAAIAGIPLAEVTPEQRGAAKAIVFGTVYGAGAKGIRATAWAHFGVDLTLEQAGAAREAFLNRYSGVRRYQRRQADVGRASGVVRSVLGRPLRAEWEKEGRLRYTQCVNFPIQSSAADVMLLAMANVDRAMPGTTVLQVHDELVLEVPEDRAGEAAAFLPACMAAAFSELFPGAPMTGLVKVKVAPAGAT
jgi:DNA polymerase I